MAKKKAVVEIEDAQVDEWQQLAAALTNMEGGVSSVKIGDVRELLKLVAGLEAAYRLEAYDRTLCGDELRENGKVFKILNKQVDHKIAETMKKRSKK